MSHIGSIRRNGGSTPGGAIESTTQTEVITEAFSAGYAITLTDVGSGVLTGTLLANYNEKALVRGEDYDYIFTAPDQIELNFADDPTQYANGEIILQISYAYNA